MRNKYRGQNIIKKRNICIAGATDDKWIKGKKTKFERLKKCKIFKENTEILLHKNLLGIILFVMIVGKFFSTNIFKSKSEKKVDYQKNHRLKKK